MTYGLVLPFEDSKIQIARQRTRILIYSYGWMGGWVDKYI